MVGASATGLNCASSAMERHKHWADFAAPWEEEGEQEEEEEEEEEVNRD